MTTKRKLNVTYHSRRSNVYSLLLALFLPLTLGSGCQSHPDFVSIPAPITEPAVVSSTKSQVERQVDQYIADIQADKTSKAESIMSPTFRSTVPSTALELAMQKNYLPFRGSSNWKYDLVNSLHHGNTIVVHAGFIGRDKHPYRANFIFTKFGADWLLDSIVGPSKQGPASIRSSSFSAAPKK